MNGFIHNHLCCFLVPYFSSGRSPSDDGSLFIRQDRAPWLGPMLTPRLRLEEDKPSSGLRPSGRKSPRIAACRFWWRAIMDQNNLFTDLLFISPLNSILFFLQSSLSACQEDGRDFYLLRVSDPCLIILSRSSKDCSLFCSILSTLA